MANSTCHHGGGTLLGSYFADPILPVKNISLHNGLLLKLSCAAGRMRHSSEVPGWVNAPLLERDQAINSEAVDCELIPNNLTKMQTSYGTTNGKQVLSAAEQVKKIMLSPGRLVEFTFSLYPLFSPLIVAWVFCVSFVLCSLFAIFAINCKFIVDLFFLFISRSACFIRQMCFLYCNFSLCYCVMALEMRTICTYVHRLPFSTCFVCCSHLLSFVYLFVWVHVLIFTCASEGFAVSFCGRAHNF